MLPEDYAVTTSNHSLFVYEEIMLLALRDEEGTCANGYVEYMTSGAILTELLLEERISIDAEGKQIVEVLDASPLGDPIIDECVELIASAKKPKSLKHWISQVAGIKDIRHRVARQLCEREILRADEHKVLLLFTRKIYPEVDPGPEDEIIQRLRNAIFSDVAEVDARTTVLISLASSGSLLNQVFDKKEIKSRKARVEQIAAGELMGEATGSVIEAIQAAILVAVLVPTLITTTMNN